MRQWMHLVGRDVGLAIRQGSDATMAVFFFVLAAMLFPFGVGPEPNILARIAPGILWVSALLATLLSLDRLFQADHDDGSLEQLWLAGLPLEAVALAKTTAHWLITGLPLMVAAPLVAIGLNLGSEGFGVLVLSLLLGTPALSLIGSVGAALTVGARRGGVLIALLVLPLEVPVLIFATGAMDQALAGLAARSHLMLLGAILAAALPLAPLAAAAALRQALE